MNRLKVLPFFILVLVIPVLLKAQKKAPLAIALEYLDQNHSSWGLSPNDLDDIALIRQFTSRHNQVTHLYFGQRYQGIPVFNSILGVHLDKDGKVFFATSRFIPGVSGIVNADVPRLTAYGAIERAAVHLDLKPERPLPLIRAEGKTAFLYDGGSLSRRPIRVELVYQPTAAGLVRLAWDLAIEALTTTDYWSLRVDALTGEILDQYNLTVHCTAGSFHTQDDELCVEENPDNAVAHFQGLNAEGANYRVFALPDENPSGSQRRLLINPEDREASPLGWHDVDGQPGPDYYTTRGNNTFAYFDVDFDGEADGDEPQVGESMLFDFPYDPFGEPEENRNAGLTQLFYTTNMLHDFAYRYGFDEAAGNFQQNNYGREGYEGDPILAEGQNGQWRNNASFTTSPDGLPSTMRMYLWEITRGPWLKVTSPAVLADSFLVSLASFGPQLSYEGISGKIVATVDNGDNPRQACSPIINGPEVAGNIAMIDRGTCYFEEKVINAVNVGAVAVIICNYDQSVIEMGGLESLSDPEIPAVMLGADDCQRIRNFLARGVTATLQFPPDIVPRRLDGSFDNGIVAHEYAHGISIRLTGGADKTGCLVNDEQMGEGWSDFFTLITTTRPGENGRAPRGVGHYVLRSGDRGVTLRTVPYSTDFDINDLTYEDIVGTEGPYRTGEVWATILWDLYWRFVEEYGYSEDLLKGQGGNNIAIQLVMDALKLQACNPGFADGRDALLFADLVTNQGVNRCLIWEVFARRGLGYGAEQGNPDNRNDAVASYDLAPTCVRELKIAKAMTPTILPGGTIEVTLTVTNDKAETTPGVVIIDELPPGASYVPGSVAGPVVLEADARRLTFLAGDLGRNQQIKITYKLITDPAYFSKRQFLEEVESGSENWNRMALAGNDGWTVSRSAPYRGDYSWWVPNAVRRNDQALELRNPVLVSGEQPVLRFWHRYDIQPGLDGGIVELSRDGGGTWTAIPSDLLLRNDYRGRLAEETLGGDRMHAFWGNSGGYIDSYVDLRPFLGEEINLRFRYGALENVDRDSIAGGGWFIDNIEIMDMVNFQSEACAYSDAGDQSCTMASALGTVAESAAITTSTAPLEEAPLKAAVFPNPATNFINVALRTTKPAGVTIGLFTADGRQLQNLTTTTLGPEELIVPIQTGNLSTGLYFIKVSSPEMTVVEKVVINRRR